MRKAKILAALFVILCLSSCDEQGICLKGDGKVESRTVDLDRIDGVRVHGSTRVYVRKGDRQQIEVKGQPNILNELGTSVDDGTWDIRFDRCLSHHETVEVYLTVPVLRSAKVNGSGYIKLEDKFRGREFDAAVSGSGDIQGQIDTEMLNSDISGSGSIELSGAAREQDIRISGSGNHHAFNLKSRVASVRISGSGKVQVYASRELDVQISGSGRVHYKGNPSTDIDVSGSGKVMKD